MSVPLWVPWVLVLSLAWPAIVVVVIAGRDVGARGSRLLLVTLVPALVMGVVAVMMTVDRAGISEDELEDASAAAARALDGSLGAVDAERVAALVAVELGQDVDVHRSELSVQDEVNASYEIEVRPGPEVGAPAACVSVTLEVMDAKAPDLRFADVTSRPGPCS